MLPVFYIQPVSIALAVVVNFIFGAIWYGPLFGELWADLIATDTSKPPKTSEILKGVVLNIIGTAFTAFTFSHLVQVTRASSWGIPNQDEDSRHIAFITAIFVWIGFYIPLLLNSIAWERRSWGLFFLNAAYYFFYTQIIAFITSVTA